MRPISTAQKLGIKSRLLVAAFFGVFLAFGLGFLTPIFVLPVVRAMRALDWQQASCDIVSARVSENSDSDGTTYRVDVNYRYEFGGQVYAGDRYRFVRMSTSGRGAKTEAVERLNRERRVDCWVDPGNPTESVIERGLSAEMWFALIPLVFVIVGAGGIYGAFRMSGGSTPMTFGARRVAVQLKEPSGAGRLRPRFGRRTALAGYLLIALFWNGVVSVFLYQVVGEWSRGRGFQWLLALFLVPFVVVGLVLIGAAVHRALSLFNPRFELSVTSRRVALGEELGIEWSSARRVDKLARFSILLEGREEATYRRGTDSKTDTHVFHAHMLVHQIPPDIDGFGKVKVVLPADSMHSFEAGNNKVVWLLRVHGEVPKWPDTNEEFPLTVGPRR